MANEYKIAFMSEFLADGPSTRLDVGNLLDQRISNERLLLDLQNAVRLASDDQLKNMVPALQEIELATLSFVQDTEPGSCGPYAFAPNPEHAQLLPGGQFAIPIADKRQILDFLESEAVMEMLDHVRDPDQHDSDPPVLDETTPALVLPHKIADLPKPFEPIDMDHLYAMVAAYYWAENAPSSYVSPADTLNDIVRALPTELLVPLILRLEAHYPKMMDEDACYKPIVWSYREKVSVQDGIVWMLTDEQALRFNLESATEESLTPEVAEGFDHELFNEWYVMDVAATNEKDSHLAIDRFEEEITRRERARYGRIILSA